MSASGWSPPGGFVEAATRHFINAAAGGGTQFFTGEISGSGPGSERPQGLGSERDYGGSGGGFRQTADGRDRMDGSRRGSGGAAGVAAGPTEYADQFEGVKTGKGGRTSAGQCTERSRFMRWVDSGRQALTPYFQVSNRSVLSKLSFLLFPYYRLVRRALRRKPKESGAWLDSQEGNINKQYSDENREANKNLGDKQLYELDLYLPLMAFLTYIIVYGYHQVQFSKFEPKVLSERATLCLSLTLLEALIFRSAYLWLSLPSKYLNCVALCGSVYVHLSVALLIQIAPFLPRRHALAISGFLCVSCLITTTVQSVKNDASADTAEWGGRNLQIVATKLYCALALSALQLPLFYFLLPSSIAKV